MIYRQVKNTDLLLSIIGYGGWGAGIKGWPDVSEKKVCESIDEAIKYGINIFDTSPLYGNGMSETLLGSMLASWRKYVIISTKFGLVDNGFGKIHHDLSRDSMLRELESSLTRLKTDYIDIYTVHFPDGINSLERVFNELLLLKKNNVIRNIAASNLSIEDVKIALSCGVVIIQNKFNLIDSKDCDEVIPFCKTNSMGYFAYSPLSQGLFTDKVNDDFKLSKNDVRRFNPVFSNANNFNNALKIKESLQDSPLYSSLKYVLETEGVTTALITMTRPEHVRQNVKIIESIFKNK